VKRWAEVRVGARESMPATATQPQHGPWSHTHHAPCDAADGNQAVHVWRVVDEGLEAVSKQAAARSTQAGRIDVQGRQLPMCLPAQHPVDPTRTHPTRTHLRPGPSSANAPSAPETIGLPIKFIKGVCANWWYPRLCSRWPMWWLQHSSTRPHASPRLTRLARASASRLA
jgi:hypothetical protein